MCVGGGEGSFSVFPHGDMSELLRSVSQWKRNTRIEEDRNTRVILKVFSVMFSTLLRSGFVLVRRSIVLCSQEWFEH